MKRLSLKEHQAVLLNLLDVFDQFCRKHDLEYFLAYGTLLGAIRHKGFIPWDDDVDVFMKYEDYLRFVELWEKECQANTDLAKRYKTWGYEGEENYYMGYLAKFFDTHTHLVEHMKRDIYYGAYLDIFVLENLPENEKALKHFLMSWRHNSRWARSLSHKNIGLNRLKCSWLPTPYRYLQKLKKLRSEVTPSETSLIGPAGCAERKRYMHCVYDKSLFNQSTRVPFEHLSLPVPQGFDKLLTLQYGDYMTPPPEGNRQGHDSEVYLKEEGDF